MKYYNYGNFGQVYEDEVFYLPIELWPKKELTIPFVTISIKGRMVVKAGCVWDYATVPFFKRLSNWLAGRKSKVPSLAHDVLCRMHRRGMLPMDPDRFYTDRYFYHLLLTRKFWRIRAKGWFKAVRLGAKYSPQKPKEVLEAP